MTLRTTPRPAKRDRARTKHTNDSVSEAYDNVFEVFGHPDASERLAKAKLARIIRKHVQAHVPNEAACQ